MRNVIGVAVSVVAIALASAPMWAQWPSHPTPGVPRLDADWSRRGEVMSESRRVSD